MEDEKAKSEIKTNTIFQNRRLIAINKQLKEELALASDEVKVSDDTSVADLLASVEEANGIIDGLKEELSVGNIALKGLEDDNIQISDKCNGLEVELDEMKEKTVADPTYNEEFNSLKSDYEALKRRLGSAEYQFISVEAVEGIIENMKEDTKAVFDDFCRQSSSERLRRVSTWEFGGRGQER